MDGTLFKMEFEPQAEDSPKDWRRATVKEYLRERHAMFELEKKAREDGDSSDEEMKDMDFYQKQFVEYFKRTKR